MTKQLQQELIELKSRVEAEQLHELHFRKANQGFNPREETTKLLLEACEKLALEKEAMEKANFEEHTSELPYLCRHFGTSISDGLSERFRQGRVAKASAKDRKRSSSLFAICFQSAFPPNQAWWIDISKTLVLSCEVLREKGRLDEVEAAELGPGEIFYLRAGQRAPLDARILVHSKDAVLGVTQRLGDGYEVRSCSTQATTLAVSASANVVLKDSFLMKGELFCMAVRSASNALLPACSSPSPAAEDEKFEIDQSLPSGLSASQCRSMFRQLCTKARMACRSFCVIPRLARAKSLVVLVHKELLSKTSITALAAFAKRSGRALVLVDCGCGHEAVRPLCQELEVELVDFVPLVDTTATTAHTSPRGSHTASPSSSVLDLPLRQTSHQQVLSETERHRLSALVGQLAANRGQTAAVTGLSKAGLCALCQLLNEQRMPPLLATGSFSYPEAFMRLTGPAKPVHPPKAEGCYMVSERSVELAGTGSKQVKEGSANATPRESTGMGSRDLSAQCLEASDAGSPQHADPAKALNLLADIGRGCLELVISVGASGVVAERADGIITKPDLAHLVQALDVVAKVAVPE